jgi:hypothetical protein
MSQKLLVQYVASLEKFSYVHTCPFKTRSEVPFIFIHVTNSFDGDR